MPTKTQEIAITPVRQNTVRVFLLGASPLICHRLAAKAQQELLMPRGRMNAAAKATNLKHDPVAEFRDSVYTKRDGTTHLGFLATSFKNAMSSAALDLPGASKSQIGRLVYVEGDLVDLYGIPKLHMAVVRNTDIARTPDVRTRAILPEWAVSLDISFVTPIIKPEDVYTLISAAGVISGAGDWRPQKGKGGYGRFEVVNGDDPRWLKIADAGSRKVQELAMESPEAYDEETERLLAWYMDTARTRGFAPTAAEVAA